MGIKEPMISGLNFIRMPEIFTDILINGIYNTLAWVVSVMLPPMMIFFPLFTLLEDLGILPRLAFNLDGCFKCCNACGKQALTMAMGFGCNASAIASCRIIDSKRERLIAIITNTFMPCNGRFPALIAIITIFFTDGKSSWLGAVFLTLLIFLGIGATFLVSFILSKTILKGYPSSVIIEMPQIRKPQFINVLIRSLIDRTFKILVRAMKIAAPVGLVIWCMGNISVNDVPIITIICDSLDKPASFLGLDGESIVAFALGWPANEIVIPVLTMAYMESVNLVELSSIDALGELLVTCGWTIKTAICFMVFSLLHWPCATTFFTIKKEVGEWKWALVSLAIPTVFAIIIVSLINFCFVLVS